jgi:uncharacterized lipoprotein
MRRLLLSVASMAVLASCSADHVTEAAPRNISPDQFTGTWRSVTPTLEFVRLTVASKSSEQGAFGTTLAFSGVMWTGTGRIDADSLVIDQSVPGASGPQSVLVLRSPDDDTLTARQ